MDRKKQNNQLYVYMRRLSPYIPNEDELGTVLGYSVVGSLVDFNTSSGSIKERKYEEIKKIYSFLNDMIDSCESIEGYDPLNSLEGKLDPLFDELGKVNVAHNAPKFKSELLTKILDKRIIGKVRNPYELMRRVGIKMQREAQDNGYFMRTIDCLVKDYEVIEHSFELRGYDDRDN